MIPRCANILVVDDDPTSRLIARSHLEQDGHRVCEAEDGVHALEAVMLVTPDLVLLDVDMPRLDGFATCESLRAIEALTHTPIVMMTGAQDDEAIGRAYASGATDFVVKPVSWTILKNRVRYLLRTGEVVAELDESRRMLSDAQRMAALGNWAWQPGEATITCSDELRRLLQLDAWADIHLTDFVGRFSATSRTLFKRQLDTIVQGGGEGEVACDFTVAGGEVRHGVLRLRASSEDSSACRILGTLQDITERFRAESQIRRLAYTDPVTTLPNRAAFMHQLGEALTREAPEIESAALFYVGLDDFKRVNDTFGSSFADQLLRCVGQRLTQSMRGSGRRLSGAGQETPTKVARLGGDEFALLVVEGEGSVEVEAIAARLVQVLSLPITVDGHDVHLTASVGTATFPGDAGDAERLLKCASTAMRHAKNEGKNGHSHFRCAMDEGDVRRAEMESDLRGALSRGELELHYQAQVDVSAARVDGVEALLRWTSKRLGPVSPGEFIPAAESTRLIIPIGKWVLQSACEQLARWDGEGVEIPRVAVNVSLVQFVQSDFPDNVRAALESSGIRPDRLELEITESVLAGDVQQATRILKELKSIGVQLSIDDFGTGYSSLAYLKSFPVDRVKIDRCFVQDIVTEPDDAAIAEAVLAMARSMGLGVIAEGVETPAQLGMLRARGCSLYQGYLFAKPEPVPRVAATLAGIQFPAEGSEAGTGRPRSRVLIVDDDRSLLSATRRALSRERYDVETLTSAEEALEYLARNPVDVVVSDHCMPGMSGVELLSRIRRLTPDTVRILMSGESDRAMLADAINRGAASAFLEKPVSLETLRSSLGEALAWREEAGPAGRIAV